MTTKERVIISAYTGVLMCSMDLVEAYVREKLNRDIISNEWESKAFMREVKFAARKDFLLLSE